MGVAGILKRLRKKNEEVAVRRKRRKVFFEPLEPRVLLDGGPIVVPEIETNDTFATAIEFPFPLPEDPSGSGLFTGRGTGSIQATSDQDYWKFEVLAGDIVSVSVDTPTGSLDPYAYLYNAAGSQLTGSWSEGPDND
ncbi:MAG: LEPR-XLL domain-containing protein, partial [Desulfobacterales bacterium]